jgi:hypothetical protein
MHMQNLAVSDKQGWMCTDLVPATHPHPFFLIHLRACSTRRETGIRLSRSLQGYSPFRPDVSKHRTGKVTLPASFPPQMVKGFSSVDCDRFK